MKKNIRNLFILILCVVFCFSCTTTPKPEQPIEPEETIEAEKTNEANEAEQIIEPLENAEVVSTEQNNDVSDIEESVSEDDSSVEAVEIEDTAEKESSEPAQEEVSEGNIDTVEIIEEDISLVEENDIEEDLISESNETAETEQISETEESSETVETLEPVEKPDLSEIIQTEENIEPIEITETLPVEESNGNTDTVSDIVIEDSDNSEQAEVISENTEPAVTTSVTTEPEVKQPVKVVPSRTVHMDIRQYLDITYPGSGWIYLGEVSEEDGTEKRVLLTYFGKRRNGEIDTSFTLRSNASGSTIVHFYKKDVLTSSFIDDYLEVIISESIAPAGTRVEAPSYSEIVPPYQFDIPNPQDFKKLESVENIPAVQIQKEEPVKFDTEKNEANIILPEQNTNTSSKPVIEPAAKTIIKEVVKEIKVEEKKEILISDVPEVVLTEEIISDESVVEEQTLSDEGLKFFVDAQEAFYRHDYKAAADLLEQFFEVANTQLDSAYYLKGQIYEAKSDIQNIRTAISAYNQVVTEFPTSPFWQLAKNRQTYLNRFYFDIR